MTLKHIYITLKHKDSDSSSSMEFWIMELKLDLFYSLLFMLLVTILLYCCIYSSGKRRISGIPGPTGWPLIGNALQLDLKRPHLSVSKMSEQFGPVVYLKVLHWDIVILNDIDVILEATLKKGTDFAGRPDLFRPWYSTFEGKDIIFQTCTPAWRELRTITHKAMKIYENETGKTEKLIQSEAEDLLTAINLLHGKESDLYHIIYDSIVCVVCVLLFGRKLDREGQTLRKIRQFDQLFNEALSMGEGVELDVLPWLRYLPNPVFAKLSKGVTIRNEVLFQLFGELKNQHETEHVDGIVGALLREKDAQTNTNQEQVISDESIMAVMGDMLVAGSDTTATNILCLILQLANNPEIQTEVQTEIDNVIGSSRQPSLKDRDNMPYLEACILESLRFCTLVPLSIPHSTITDTSVGGFDVPKGTQVWLNVWALHHNQFWSEPFRFDPTRFLDNDGKLLDHTHPRRKRLLPFGTGRRVCLGQVVAKYELFLMSAFLLQKFTFLPGHNAANAADPKTFTLGVILHPTAHKLYAKVRHG